MTEITRQRLRGLVRIAFPMLISQASETVMLFVDRLFLSRLSKIHLAAAMSGGLTSFVLSSLFVGMVGYVNAIVAQYYGSGRKDQCARATTQAIYAAVLSYPILLLFIPFTKYFFQAFGLEAEQVALTDVYVRYLLAGSVMFVARNALTGFFTGIGRTRIVMTANIAAMLINIPANYVFIFGKLGFPALGMRGAAIGTLCGSFSALLMLLITYLRVSRSPEYRAEHQWRFDRTLMKKLLRFGLPAGTETLLNMGAFNLFVQLMHSYGSNVAAAVTIAFNWDLVAFIPMFGLGIATTAVVGQHIGARDFEGAEASAYLSLHLGYVYSGLMMVLFIAGAGPLVRVFSSGFTDAEGVPEMAMLFLRLVSLYTVADATNIIFAGSLRGAGDTKWVMRLSVVVHWTLATTAFICVKVVHVRPLVVWSLFIGMILILGFVMVLRFRTGRWKSIELI